MKNIFWLLILVLVACTAPRGSGSSLLPQSTPAVVNHSGYTECSPATCTYAMIYFTVPAAIWAKLPSLVLPQNAQNLQWQVEEGSPYTPKNPPVNVFGSEWLAQNEASEYPGFYPYHSCKGNSDGSYTCEWLEAIGVPTYQNGIQTAVDEIIVIIYNGSWRYIPIAKGRINCGKSTYNCIPVKNNSPLPTVILKVCTATHRTNINSNCFGTNPK